MGVTSAAAILALALCAQRPPLSLTRDAERVSLPASAGPVTLEARPFTQEWVLHVPSGGAAALAARLRGASRLCPEVTAVPGEVILRCVTSRLRATLVHDAGGAAVTLFRLSVPPWRPEDEGPPLVGFDLDRLHLGPCPGRTPAVQGECALMSGDRATAHSLFQDALRAGPSALAELRLGDLALADDAPDVAVVHWRRAKTEAPWGRLASARMCELEPKCLASEAMEAVYDTTAVEHALRADIVLRRVRLMAFGGDLVEAARRVSGESQPGGACQSASAWCRHVLLLALRLPPPTGAEALPAYLDLYNRREGPLALELVRAAAAQAEAMGAPVFAANLLASATGTIPPAELDDHLARTVGLFLAGRDRARADEIFRYARARLGEAALRAPRWAALRNELRPAPASAAPPPATAATGEDPAIAAAQAAVEAARLAHPPQPVQPPPGGTP